MISKELIQSCSCTFSNGVTVVNTTPHPLNFQSPNGEKIIVPSSVPVGEKTGPLVINATAKEVPVTDYIVDTTFEPNNEGTDIIYQIQNAGLSGKVMIVGSMIAANAYPEVVGMCPAPGFERVPPADKLMSCEKFTMGAAKMQIEKETAIDEDLSIDVSADENRVGDNEVNKKACKSEIQR